MAEGFQELGLSETVLASLEQLGFSRPTSIQRAAIPVIRRGGNIVIHAGSGAGVTAAYGLGLIDRLLEVDATGPTQVLVVTATEERAAATALELGRLARRAGIRAGVRAPAWNTDATIVVVPASRVLSLVESSTLKLDELKALVLHDVATLLALGEETALEALLPIIPRDAQRILVTTQLTPAVEKLAEAHARKALHVPARPAIAEEAEPAAPPAARVEYRVVTAAHALEQLAQLAARQKATLVFCRTEEAARRVREQLHLRGLDAEARLYGESAGAEPVLGYGAPFDAETMATAFANGGTVVIEPAALPHLRQIAGQANIALKATRAEVPLPSAVERFRAQLRRALAEEDIEAQMLVLLPLFDEFSPAEVAAAAAALLRKRTAEPTAAARPAQGAPAPSAFIKLFISIGQRDGIATRELVGAITGEAGVSGDQIGRVDVRDTFSIVEVAAAAADQVIRKLNGTSLRGRSLRVDYDRGATGARRRLSNTRRG